MSKMAGPLLAPVEVTLREEFLPAVLGRLVLILDNGTWVLMAQTSKNGGLCIRNPVRAVDSLHRTLEKALTVLVDA